MEFMAVLLFMICLLCGVIFIPLSTGWCAKLGLGGLSITCLSHTHRRRHIGETQETLHTPSCNDSLSSHLCSACSICAEVICLSLKRCLSVNVCGLLLRYCLLLILLKRRFLTLVFLQPQIICFIFRLFSFLSFPNM